MHSQLLIETITIERTNLTGIKMGVSTQVLFWNAQGINNKKDEFLQLLMEEGVEIACLCESHLTINSPDITNDRYDIIRQDTPTNWVDY